ncbi:MAG TPA: tetratricopeptide repeat protein [Terriglobales bacterium]|nr:tetratricopeptide repeat protein [Terriglobales bacterium]HXY13381.1 tetratricopeptide repeat protein [Terriglobales bacterium]
MISAILLLWLAGQSLSSEAAQHLQAGIAAEKDRQPAVAIEEFRKVTELEPNLAEGFVQLGQAYMQNRDYGSAITPLKHALKIDPDLVPAHQLLGYALLTQGFAAEAIPHLQRVQDKTALGIAQIQTGQFPDAVANLQAALAAHPNDPDVLYYLGRASGLLSKQSIDTLLAAYPESARSHQAMGENYFVLRRMQDAEQEYHQALQLRPDIPEVHLELGEVYAGAFQWAKAEEEFRAETRMQPGNAEAFYRLGAALLEQGKAHEARAELVRADKLLPDMPETLYSLGKAASLDGDAAAAEKAWLKLLAIEKATPLAAQAHFGLAGLYRTQGKTADAQREMQEFQRLQQGSVPPQQTAKPDAAH